MTAVTFSGAMRLHCIGAPTKTRVEDTRDRLHGTATAARPLAGS
ncbi:hypothetical protein J2853_006325 [Streptosporangium lutulentum]|uniref:Uncharacterized protein n=1 Tax=Streptosporangium lutulentum TaxID=1461250 RepID=A0ABT9QM49_9ACTN|nr:hypothetical protein [Streptosporangium lutulentum]